jgi:hypothetical protein
MSRGAPSPYGDADLQRHGTSIAASYQKLNDYERRTTMKKIVTLVLALALVMAFAAPAMAAGNYIAHSGTSTSGYYTTDYFEQKNDRNIHCTFAYSTNPMQVAPAVYGTSWSELTSRMTFQTGHLFILNTSATVRRVHLHLVNTVSSSTYSSGNWELRA